MTFNFDKKLSLVLALYGTSMLVSGLIYFASAKLLEEKTRKLNLIGYRLSKEVKGLLEAQEDNNKKNK